MNLDEADAVFQGGGVKGLALAGALLGFAERGYRRWVNVAGTGAGAVLASYLACGHDVYEAEQLLRSAPNSRFEDFGPGGRFLGGTWNLLRRRGFARGEYLRRWLDEQLDGRTFAAVTEHDRSRLKLLAVDVTRRELLVLPDDLPRYRVPGGDSPIDPGRFRIADAVRMSASLPYIFEPVELVHHATSRASAILDGGLLSNVPVWLFDVDDRDPLRPTFGFRLTGGPRTGRGFDRALGRIGRPLELSSDIVQVAMESWDTRLMSGSTRARTCPVPAGSVATAHFRLTPLEQTELVENGRRAARRFLDSFDLDAYRNTYGRALSAAVHA